MDDLSTFLELPLERELYHPKEFASKKKKPIRVLITEAGCKLAQNLIYEICSGEVFGSDQQIILHLANARGTVDHKTFLLEIEECGFNALLDSVVTCEPSIAYKKVDFVVLIATFEELSGQTYYISFLSQLAKSHLVARNMMRYAKRDAKLVVCSPSSKGICVLLTCLKHLLPEMNWGYVSGVSALDETISKSYLAAKLKTTTDVIKNVVIWGAAHPDAHNATVYTHSPGDLNIRHKVEQPVSEVLQNDAWLTGEFITNIYKRVIVSELLRFGKAVAMATAKHLKVLMSGTKSLEEISSMMIVTPPDCPYGIESGIGFSFPVEVENQLVTVRNGVKCDTTSHLMNIRVNYNLFHSSVMKDNIKILTYIMDEETKKEGEFSWHGYEILSRCIDHIPWTMKLIITPIAHEADNVERWNEHKKSVNWNEINISQGEKSMLKFNLSKEDCIYKSLSLLK